MGRLNFLYKMDLPHRAKLVYIYLHDRMDKEKKKASATVPEATAETRLTLRERVPADSNRADREKKTGSSWSIWARTLPATAREVSIP